MLTGDLMRVRITGKSIHPALVPVRSSKHRENANAILSLFQGQVGLARRGTLQEGIQSLSGTEVDHKLIRGLGKIALDSSSFRQPHLPSGLTPRQLRRSVFERAAEKGPLRTAYQPQIGARPTPEELLSEVASEHQIAVSDIQQCLYADRKEMFLLEAAPHMESGQQLIQRYNLVLCQSLLLHASELEITISDLPPKWLRAVFRKLKFHQLLFRVLTEESSSAQSNVRIIIDGPQSLLRQSTRYGMQLANCFSIFPSLPGDWEISATVLWGKKRKLRKQLVLNSSQGLVGSHKARGVWRSNAELWFEERFLQKQREWTIGPGEMVLLGEQRALFPEFKFTKGTQQAYLEILGFWRKKNLRELLSVSPPNILFAVSKRLSGETAALPKNLAARVILFAEVISVPTVLKQLDVIQAQNN